MSGHTKGPWKTDGDEIILSPDGRNLADVWTEFAAIPRAEAVANARLIASAPDLLEALKAAEEYMAFNATENSQPYPLDRVRAAIAKAEGRS